MAAIYRNSSIPDRIGTNGAKENSNWSYQFSENAFIDPDGLIITYTAQYESSVGVWSALPAWLVFDGPTRTFSITKQAGVIGTYNIRVTATDTESTTATDDFYLEVVANQTPIVNDPLVDQIAYYGTNAPAFYYQIPISSITDPDGDDLTKIAYVVVNGVETPIANVLPSISFSEGARKFSGYPTEAEAGTHIIRVRYSDGMSSISDDFTLLIRLYNQPVVANYTPEGVYAYPDKGFSWTLPSNLFTDPEGVTLVYNIVLNDGFDSDLPIWLTWDSVENRIHGTPDVADIEVINLKITADDGENVAVTTLQLSVQAYQAPFVNSPLAAQTKVIGKKLAVIVPFDTFVSPTNEPLTYSISNAPNFISVDSIKRRLLGTIDNFRFPSLNNFKLLITDNTLLTGSSLAINFLISEVQQSVVEGTNFTVGATIADTATNIATVINGLVGVSAVSDGINTITITADSGVKVGDSYLSNNTSGLEISFAQAKINITASDPFESISDSLLINIYANRNLPILDNPIPNQTVIHNATFNYQVPLNTFSVPTGSLTYRAYVPTSEGYEDVLPSWLSFDSSTRTFSGVAEDLELLTTKMVNLAVVAKSEDNTETVGLFYLTISTVAIRPIAKTDAECKMVIYVHPSGTTLPANIITDSRIELNFLSTDNIDINFNLYNLLGGDTVGIHTMNGAVAGKRIRINNINGEIGNSIYVTNVGGVCKFSGFLNFLWKMQGCNNVIFAGQGTPDDPCGIKLYSLNNPDGGGAGAAIQYNIDCHYNVEFAYIHIGAASAAGFSIKNNLTPTEGQLGDPDPAFPEKDNMDGIRVQYCLIEKCDTEGLYIGNGFYSGKPFPDVGTKYPHIIRHVRVEDNVIFHTGWDPLQFKNCAINVKIRRNYAFHSGFRQKGGQNEGVNMGDGLGDCIFEHNFIHQGRNTALRFDPSGNSIVRHCVFIGYENVALGWANAIYGARRGRLDDPLLANIPNSSQFAAVYNNTFVYIAAPNELVKLGIDVDNTYVRNNLFITSGSKVIKIDSGGEESNNLAYGSIDSAQFVDIDNYDFRPKSTSPVLGAGIDMSAYGTVTDYNGNTVDWLNPHVGAYVNGPTNYLRGDRLQALYLASSAPVAPSGLSATTISSSRVDLSWTDNAIDETKFIIERKQGTSSWTQIGETAENVTTFAAIGLNASTTYSFRIRASNLQGESSYTTEVSATTEAAALTIPLAPSNFILVAKTDKTANISWELNSTNETSIRIESYNGTTWSTIATLVETTTTTKLENLLPETQYTLRVIASNAAGDSTPSSSLIFTTLVLQEVSTEGIYWAYEEGGILYTGFNYTRLLIPSTTLNKPNFYIISDTTQKPLPIQKYQTGKRGDMRYAEDSITKKITKMAFCVEDNVWAIVDFSTLVGSSTTATAWVDLTGVPSDNTDLTAYIQSLSFNPAYKRFSVPKVVHTGSTVRTVLYTLTIPAGTIKANSIISVKPQIDITNPSTLAVAFEVLVGGQTVLSHNSTTSDSYSREQEVYIGEINGTNNTKNRIATGTSSQEGALNSSLSKATIDWSIEQTIEMAGTLADIGDTIELTGGLVEIITGSDTL